MGFIDKADTKIHAAQTTGCCPIVTAVKENNGTINPVKPQTIAKSLAVGNPANGTYAVNTVR